MNLTLKYLDKEERFSYVTKQDIKDCYWQCQKSETDN